MPTSKSSGRSSRSKASTARKATSTRRGGNEAAREQLQRFLDPREVIVVTRERLQEALDEAVERGRMTRDDATEVLQELIRRGTAPADRLIREVGRAAGIGAGFPIAGYDDMTAAQVTEHLDGLTPAQLRTVRDHERRNANRKSVLAAVDRKLD